MLDSFYKHRARGSQDSCWTLKQVDEKLCSQPRLKVDARLPHFTEFTGYMKVFVLKVVIFLYFVMIPKLQVGRVKEGDCVHCFSWGGNGYSACYKSVTETVSLGFLIGLFCV